MSERIEQKDTLDQYKDHMILYSIETNRKRSVPDVRDGLKKVHRRIIDSMYNELHATDRLVKTAKVVGDVIGRTHPHGDCFRANTQLYMLNGTITTAGDLYNKGITTFESLGVNPITLKVEPIIAHDLRIGQYTDKVYHIGLSNRTEFQCTANHPVMIYNGDYVKAENLKEGMLLYTTLQTIQSNGSVQLTGYNDTSAENNRTNIFKYNLYQNIDKLILAIKDYQFSYADYIQMYPNWAEKISAEEFAIFVREYFRTRPVITKIWVEDVDQEPMFDFTVDTTNNMIIPVIDRSNMEFNEIPFICVHNSGVIDAIKPLCNWFEIKEPLLFSPSNMGNMQGNGAAAPRYTEIKLSEFCKDCVISDMKNGKEVVDWVPNFDNTSEEPEYFPVAVPLLLINGTFGLGVGMMTEIPKHNLVEVIDATIRLIKNPNSQVVLIPDHCMPCEIIDTNWKSICNKGNGKYTVRGIIDIERYKDHDCLIIRSAPDRVFYDRGNEQNGGVHYKILNMVKEGKLPQITKIDEDSKGNNMRIVIHLRKGSDPNYVKEMLYRTTQLQDTYTVNFEVLNGTEPLRLSYKAYLEYFIEERKLTKFRANCIMLQKVRTEYHKREAYVKVLESGYIDKIIDMIKNQTTIDDNVIVEYIVKHAKITDIQAKFIINSNIKNLSKAYLKKYKEEMKKYAEQDKYYENKITHEELILQDIINELEYFKKKYGKPRTCRVISKEELSTIPKGEFKLVITENNYVKKLSLTEPIGSYRGDNPKHVLKVDNTENVLLFSTQGKVFRLPVHKVPLTEKGSIGLDIRIMLKGLTSDITKVIYEPTLKEVSKLLNKHHLTVVTNNNCIKKLDVEDFLNVPPSGIIYTKLNPNDFVKDILLIPDNLDVIIYSNRKALRVNMQEIPKYKRSTLGVSAMNLSNGECIDGISVIYPDATDIIVITEAGKINKFDISGLQRSNRYKAGSSVIKLGKNDRIHSIYGVNDKNTIQIITKNEKLEIPVAEIPKGSSLSSGVRKIQTKNDVIVKCNVIK